MQPRTRAHVGRACPVPPFSRAHVTSGPLSGSLECWAQSQGPRVCVLAPPLSREATVRDTLSGREGNEGWRSSERLL